MYLSASLSYKATSDPSLDGKKVMDFSDWKTFTMTSGDKTVQNTYRIKVVSKAQAETPVSVFRRSVNGTMASLTTPKAPSLSPMWTIPS